MAEGSWVNRSDKGEKEDPDIVLIQVLISGILLGGIYALVSIGLTMIFGVIKIVNFAHGEVIMLAMYGTYWLFQYFGLDPYLSILVIVPVFFLFGLLLQRAVIQPIIKAPHVAQIFATVALSVIFQNVALMLWKGDYRTVQTAYVSSVLHLGPISVGLTRVVAFLVTVAVSAILFLFLNKTYLGKAIRAVSQDPEAARLMGIKERRVQLVAFAIGSACAGLAGVLLMPIFYVFPSVGSYFVLTAFVVVVLGGMGNMAGALFGGLIIGCVEALSGYFLATALKEAVYLVIFLVILFVRPSGLFGNTGMESSR